MAVKRKMRKRSNAMAKRVSLLEKKFKAVVERKVTDLVGTSPSGTDIPTTGWERVAWAIFSGQGTNDTEYVGDKVIMKSQHWRGQIIIPTIGVSNDPNNQVRLLIVENLGYDSASDLTIEDVLEFGSYATDGDLVFSSPYKSRGTNTKLYKVHYDRNFHLTSQNKPYANIDFKKSYGKVGKLLTFSGTGSTTPNNHRMCVFAISDSSVADHPQLFLTCRTYYQDA